MSQCKTLRVKIHLHLHVDMLTLLHCREDSPGLRDAHVEARQVRGIVRKYWVSKSL